MAQQPAIDPMHQFLIHKIVQGPVFHVGGLNFDMSITNSVASMIAGALILIVFFVLTARREIVPNRGQALAESLYNIIDRVLVGPIIGHEGKPYVPYIFALFLVILVLNLMSVVLAIGNVGGLDLSIDNVRAACSCTAAVPLTRVIPPGGAGVIDVTFDTTREHGHETRTITVYSNDPMQPVITLTLVADIETAVVAEPSELYVGHVHRGAPASNTVRLVSAEGTAVGPAETTGAVLDASVNGMAPQRTPATLRVAIKPHAPLGRFKESVLLHTQNTRQPLLTIPVVGIVDPDVRRPLSNLEARSDPTGSGP